MAECAAGAVAAPPAEGRGRLGSPRGSPASSSWLAAVYARRMRLELEHLVGRDIIQVRVDHGFELVLFDEDDDVRVRLSQFAIDFEDGAGEKFDPENRAAELGRAFAVLRTVIEAAAVEDNGQLRLQLSGVGTLTAEPSEDFESWEITGPGTKLFVCTAGGEVAEWV